MPHDAAVLTRHWLLLRALPRAPRKIDTATLQRRLAAQGLTPSRRSIQRDLQALSAVFPLVCDDRSRPYGWSWARDAHPFDLPAMDPRTALTFQLVDRYVGALLPQAILQTLRPHIERASQVLDTLDDNALARWPDKIRVIPDAVTEQPPPIPDEVTSAVHEALLHERMLTVCYRRRGASQRRELVVHPLALLFRGPLVYLVCTADPNDQPITLLLSRAEEARCLDTPRRQPPSFDLDAFLAEGSPAFPLADAPVHLVARVHRSAAQRLIEAPPHRRTVQSTSAWWRPGPTPPPHAPGCWGSARPWRSWSLRGSARS